MTAYRFEWQPWFPVPDNIVLIDTPGFADCEGLDEDKKTVKAIEELFNDKTLAVDQINAVAFVMKRSDYRLTTAEKYVFESVVTLFGNDVKSNFTAVATNAASQGGDFANLKDLIAAAGLPMKEVYG